MKYHHYYLFHKEFPFRNDVSEITLLGDLVCAPDYYKEPHHHNDNIEICLITGGKGWFILDGREYKVKQGDLFFALPNQVHYSIADQQDPYRMYYLAFKVFNDPDLEKLFIELNEVNQHVFSDRFNLAQYFSDLINEVLNDFPAREKAIETIFHTIVILLHRNCFIDKIKITQDGNEKQYLMQKIITYIDINIQKAFGLDDIASEMGYSTYYISRLFKEQMEVSLSQYWNRAKILRARYYLISKPELSLKAVAEMVGLEEYHYFSRLYKKIIGISPSLDRKRIQAS